MTTESPYRALPAVDALLASDPLAAVDAGPALRAAAARDAIAAARATIAAGEAAPDSDAIAEDAAVRARAMTRPSLGPLLNATGVVVHTNLGRAPLTTEALSRAVGACNLEYDLARGVRGSRRAHVETTLRDLAGAEASLIVNNNAAAVFLALAAIAKGREVIISRGELVEIGGSFRVPEILEASGAILREVGTTNRTYARDYAAAIGPDTAAILRVHRSNFRISGFTHRPTMSDLAEVAAQHGIPLLSDLGSGTFGPLPPGLQEPADPRAELRDGAGLVCFSGDKLLGGPQAGLMLGAKGLIDRCARHPLARALRVDKLTLAALEHTLLAYRSGRMERVPVYAMLHTPLAALSRRGRALADALVDRRCTAEVVRCRDAVGGGSHPGETIDGVAVALSETGVSADDLVRRLRQDVSPRVIAVIEDDRVLLHVRTIPPESDEGLLSAVRGALDPR